MPITDQLIEQFQFAKNTHFTGLLTIQSHTVRGWELWFRLGRLFWCSGGEHQFRRWNRLLKQFCPQIDPKVINFSALTSPEDWEYLALTWLFKHNWITRDQFIAIVTQSTEEVLFDILQSSESGATLSCRKQETTTNSGEPLFVLNSEQILRKAGQTRQDWCNVGLMAYSPNLAPVLKRPEALQQQVSATVYTTLKALVNGNSTLRDLAVLTQRDVFTVTRSLLPFLQNDWIRLQEVADVPNPNRQTLQLQAPISHHQPLVLCIDDQIRVCQGMGEILTQIGYRFIGLQDALQAIPVLLEQKPSLIFLDLVMPIASGYEVCAQIRRISAFKNTPIVILTGRDGIVDRVRARMVGASDFLAKPIDPDKVTAVVRKHLSARHKDMSSDALHHPSNVNLVNP